MFDTDGLLMFHADDPSFILANKALNSNSEEARQQTMEVFLQDGACRDVTPRLVKCRECKLTRSKKDKRVPNDFCRFYAFRRQVSRILLS